jgi:hypothetical protein
VVDPFYGGVFSLDQLRALGQTGDNDTDWLAGTSKDPNGLLAGGDHIMLPADLPAGYYTVDDSGSAVYVDVHSGSVPREFVDFYNAGKLKRDPFSNVPLNFIDPNQRDHPELLLDPKIKANLDEMFRTGATSPQQQAPFVNAPAASASDYDPKRSVGAYDKFIASGGTADMLGLGGADIRYAPQIAARDSMAYQYMQQSQAMRGLEQNREKAGLDPATGTSDAEKKRIYDLYQGITDPATKAMFISAQDPGNLIPELRQARLDARAGERALVGQNQDVVEYHGIFDGGKQLAGGAIVKRGDVTQYDEATGREHVFGGVVKSVELHKPKYDRTTDVMSRVAGGVMGAGLALASGGMAGFGTGALLAGGFAGGYSGAGGPMPQVGGAAGFAASIAMGAVMGGWLGAGMGAISSAKGLKKGRWDDAKGFGTWKVGSSQVPGGAQLGQAIVFGSIMARGRSNGIEIMQGQSRGVDLGGSASPGAGMAWA